MPGRTMVPTAIEALGRAARAVLRLPARLRSLAGPLDGDLRLYSTY